MSVEMKQSGVLEMKNAALPATPAVGGEFVAIMLAAHQMLREEAEVGTSDPSLAFSNTALCQPASGGKMGGPGFVFHSPL